MLFRKVEVFESCFSQVLKIAVTEFLKTNSDFVVDRAIEEKLLISVARVDAAIV